MDTVSHPRLRVRVLGSGTSMGVPVIGCRCPVCLSDDPRNKRLRSSVSIEAEGRHFLVDCSIDFRAQMLRWPMPRIDALLLTHTHSDHVNGLDDLRSYNYIQHEAIPVYSTRYFLDDLSQRFPYCFNPLQRGGGIPDLDPMMVEPGEPFTVKEIEIQPIEVMHGKLPILGFRLGRLAYVTDCSWIPESSLTLLEGLEVLILTALRRRPHPTHFSLEQSLEVARRVGARHVYFTHIADEMDHEQTNRELPEWARLLYDGQELEIP
ncbi:MAG: MBL fold metallo-hydrolase [bacterium]|nr:MBL fold metallo-hydrolase [bacterium]